MAMRLSLIAAQIAAHNWGKYLLASFGHGFFGQERGTLAV
jgi:hypothetical protein